MDILALPDDILSYILHFLSVSDKISARETCQEFGKNVNLMQIRIEKLDCKINKLLNGRIYILSRLRLAALCGLQEHKVADIWAWITLLGDIKTDALPILRQIGRAIYRDSIISR
jgi:hypothetical protein